MNRISLYVVRHILRFLDGKNIISCCRISKLFGNEIKENSIEYKYQMIKRAWQKSLEKRVLDNNAGHLDIERDENGDYIFYILDLDDEYKWKIEKLELLISDKSSLFSRTGRKFEWRIDDKTNKFYRDTIDFTRQHINDISIVKPYRLHSRTGIIGLWIVPLYCWSYLSTGWEHGYFHTIREKRMIVDFQKYLRENYKHEIEKHALYFFDKITYEISQCNDGLGYFREMHYLSDRVDDCWTIEALEKDMKKLIADRIGKIDAEQLTEVNKLTNLLDYD